MVEFKRRRGDYSWGRECDRLKSMNAAEKIADLESALSQALEKLEQTAKQLRELQEQWQESQRQLQRMGEELQTRQEQLQKAEARIAELEQQKTPPPAFVKANKKKQQEGEKKPRQKREAQYNKARPRSQPTEIVEHRVVNCPECDQRLGGITLARRREVIDIPPPATVSVTDHRIYQGWCSNCQKWHEAPVDLHEEVLGQGRIGVRLASLIATLRTVMRLPIRQIRVYLEAVHLVRISEGEIVELLHRMASHVQPLVDGIKAHIQNSSACQCDETGWREDGINGYIWSVSTPTLRYFEYHHSRAGEVVKRLIGEEYQGVLGSDFYAGYNIHQGFHQRCWVHFLRDVHDLKKLHPHDEKLLAWAKGVRAIYDEAVAWAAHGPDPGLSPAKQNQARKVQQQLYEQRLRDLCRPSIRTDAPQHTLCERVERFLPELFVFVAIPGVPSHNNLAERSIRPLVMARKISGGTRSPKGSQTRMTLASLFATWVAQHLNPFQQCLLALTSTFSSHQSLLPSV
jgi:transposase